MSEEQGIATIEMVVVGFVIAALIIPVVMATATLADAQSRVVAAASDGAAWMARHGTEPSSVDPEVQVTFDVRDEHVRATATLRVDLVPLIGAPLSVVVTEIVSVPVSPYRSDHA